MNGRGYGSWRMVVFFFAAWRLGRRFDIASLGCFCAARDK
jgi:hypothetical protein